MQKRYLIIITLIFATLGPVAVTAGSEIQEYAQQCFEEIGIDVEAFNCWDGEPIPGQGGAHAGEHVGPCDNPSFFNGGKGCNPGTFQVLEDNGDGFVAAICRRGQISGPDPGDGFSDIAIIQTRRSTGATCFYQIPEVTDGVGNRPEVSAPRDVNAHMTATYNRPSIVEAKCFGCHDGASVIRSPYINAVKYDGKQFVEYDFDAGKPVYVTSPSEQSKVGQPVLPVDSFNAVDSPYWLPGSSPSRNRLQPVSITTDGNVCTTCHVMGARLWTKPKTVRNRAGAVVSRQEIVWPSFYRAWDGSFSYGFMSVYERSFLEIFSNVYGALDSNTEKWWMPAGRQGWTVGADGHTIDPYIYTQAFTALETCKRELIELNTGNDFSETGYQYPDHPGCRVKPRRKIHSIGNGKRFQVTNLAIPGRSIRQSSYDELHEQYTEYRDARTFWTFGPEVDGTRAIINNASGMYLCVDSSLNLIVCDANSGPSYDIQWRVTPYDDYKSNNGVPSGYSFRLESDRYPGQFVRISDGTGLSIGEADPADKQAIWKLVPGED